LKILYRFLLLLLTLFNIQFSIATDINIDKLRTMILSSPSIALTEINLLLETNPNDHNLLFLRAVSQTKLERKKLAIETYKDLIERHPNLPEPYNNLAVLYAEQNNLAKAKEILQKALKTNSTYSIAHINLGDVYTRMASAAYRKAFELDKSPVANNKLQLINELFSYSPNMQQKKLTTTHSEPSTQTKKKNLEDLAFLVEQWKSSWENKDLEAYFSTYSKYFKLKGEMNYKKWKKIRTEKIINKKEINIELTKISYKYKDGFWFVSMNQAYSSGNYSDKEEKTLVIINEFGSYKIIEENIKNY
jgi:tetratricopeptide (TPR) repeat protein